MTLPLGLASLFFPEALQTCISASAKRELPWPITEPREQRAGGREGDSHRKCLCRLHPRQPVCLGADAIYGFAVNSEWKKNQV